MCVWDVMCVGVVVMYYVSMVGMCVSGLVMCVGGYVCTYVCMYMYTILCTYVYTILCSQSILVNRPVLLCIYMY